MGSCHPLVRGCSAQIAEEVGDGQPKWALEAQSATPTGCGGAGGGCGLCSAWGFCSTISFLATLEEKSAADCRWTGAGGDALGAAFGVWRTCPTRSSCVPVGGTEFGSVSVGGGGCGGETCRSANASPRSPKKLESAECSSSSCRPPATGSGARFSVGEFGFVGKTPAASCLDTTGISGLLEVELTLVVLEHQCKLQAQLPDELRL